MSFIVRAARREDAQHLYELARQFTLLNLPADKRAIEAKIERSQSSFGGELSKAEAEYMFVVEDVEAEMVVGSSLILAKNGTPNSPNFSFKVLKKERFSRELGIGFIHQILRLNANTDGPTEVGGLVVDRSYRRRPEKIGRLISLSRFVYIGMEPSRFEEELHSEMAPPLTEDGRSEFWEALGRRFTGMPYQEADQVSSHNNGFIQSLFPEEDIYLALLDSKARLVLGRVGNETQAALHLLTRIGFKYKDEVDPFDGGPHLGCRRNDCAIIKNMKKYKLKKLSGGQYDLSGRDRLSRDGSY
ncbi:MAG: arginine N-succinyltransferase, partial [Calothrix sp. SM1_5_4]|nr:arginine N-succinyltransferase [Calothrix sp. SM1_5_4]